MMRQLVWLVLPAALVAQTLEDCRRLQHRGRLAEASRCFERLTTSPDPYLRAEGYWGLGRYQEANHQFAAAVKLAPKNALYRVRWGRLFLDRMQRQDAAQLFQEALAIEPNHPGALLGLALVASDTFERRAIELAEKALAVDPKLVEARVLLARLALEDGDEPKAIEETDKALAIDPECLEAMALRAAADWLADREDTPWIGRILKINPVYGEAYATAARLFVLNRRYEEGVRFYRKAIELDPKLLKARAELGINLMRLGLDEEARWHLEYCYHNGEKYASVVNPLRLLDSYKNFETFTTDRFVLKLHKYEAELLRPYFEAELERAIRTFEKKYGVRLERPVRVEAYPDHEDFAVRTLGMPGLGALGVTFGYVVAMDSPNGRKPGEFHWASTLWHEMSHVFVLAATQHRAPRWFTEGMAVYEETAVSPDWGDRMTPEVIRAIRDKRLLPVTQLDRGFVRPSYPSQVVVSYFQAGRLCAFIAEKWGFAKLLEMMRGFAARKSTPQVIEQSLGLEPEELDRQFLEWLEARTRRTVEGFDQWRKGMERLAEAARAGRVEEVLREGPALRDLYPDYVEGGSAYEYLAEAYLAQGDKRAAVAELERYSRTGGRNPALIKKLAGLLEEMGRRREAAEVLERLLYIYPRDEELQRKLGDLWLAEGNAPKAIRAYRSLLALKPLDRAASHFHLARAYRAANRLEEAREQVLLALEAAPGYRPAQKLLLELNPESR
ncbi:MAG: tetratricopeptide repeat protein [Bryobacterales bacterium]|nr:tetratricopeptide repeat protein [Bryobacterales bacterium]